MDNMDVIPMYQPGYTGHMIMNHKALEKIVKRPLQHGENRASVFVHLKR